MYKAYYTHNMQPVITGDVVHFGNKAWTVEDVADTEKYLDAWIWVRSMDEEHLTVRVTGKQFGVQFFQTVRHSFSKT